MKKNGINGRISKQGISTRRNFIKAILDEGSEITISELKDRLKEKFLEQGVLEENIKIPTNQTLRKECLAIGYEYKYSRFKVKKVKSENTELIKYIFNDYLKEISVNYNNGTYIFYPYISEIHNTGLTEITYIADYNEGYNTTYNDLENSVCSNYDNIQINIILKSHQYENTLSELLYHMLDINLSYVITGLACVQLYCKKSDLYNIFSFLFDLLPDNKKTDSLHIYN